MNASILSRAILHKGFITGFNGRSYKRTKLEMCLHIAKACSFYFANPERKV